MAHINRISDEGISRDMLDMVGDVEVMFDTYTQSFSNEEGWLVEVNATGQCCYSDIVFNIDLTLMGVISYDNESDIFTISAPADRHVFFSSVGIKLKYLAPLIRNIGRMGIAHG